MPEIQFAFVGQISFDPVRADPLMVASASGYGMFEQLFHLPLAPAMHFY